MRFGKYRRLEFGALDKLLSMCLRMFVDRAALVFIIFCDIFQPSLGGYGKSYEGYVYYYVTFYSICQ